MAEEGDIPKYKFVTENGEIKFESRGYTTYATAYYVNGDIYAGYFIEGIREGPGVYRYSGSKEKYEGEWIDNQKSGIGTMYYEDGGKYKGFWENGRRHGEGVFNYANGDVYSGWWRFGEKEGTGTYYFKSTNMKMFGKWVNGQMETGKWFYPNGMYYEGKFENNKPKGEGKWRFKNGNVLAGEYE